MAYCKQYEELQSDEQVEFLARIIYAVQNDSDAFKRGAIIVNLAKLEGLYSKVKFGRDALLNEVPVLTDTKV